MKTPEIFAERVYGMLMRVPPGRVISYRDLARAVGRGSARAVGQALRRNPDAPRIPCHRVIRADGRIGGFQGGTDGEPVRKKIALLADEGVAFSADGYIREKNRILSAEELRGVKEPGAPEGTA